MRRELAAVIVGSLSFVGMAGCVGEATGIDRNGDPDTGEMKDTSSDTQMSDTRKPDTRMQDTESDVPDVEAPQIASFEVFQSSYSVGDTIRLEWSLEGGSPETLTLSPDVGDVTGETAVNVEVEGETTYTLMASNAAGDDDAMLTLMPESRGPSVSNFGAAKQTVEVGEALTFAWSVTSPGGETVECELDADSDGTVEYTISDCVSTTTQTHAYDSAGGKTAELTARTSGGEDTRTFSVTVE